MSKQKKLVSLLGPKDHDTPLERVLKRPQRLFISLVAHKEINDPKKRTVPVEETLEYIAENFEPGES
tara:strand:- start:250 stop:450 length:201 start_codon:yes stop_codon:yes gene_type:complete